MVSIAAVVRQVKDDLPPRLARDVDEALARQLGFTWRYRRLNPLTLIVLFITQVMHGNTAIEHLRYLAQLPCTATAYCKARGRLPLAVLQRLCENINRSWVGDADDVGRWRGHRLWRGDGSSFSMPDTPPLQQHFGQSGQQRAGCGFPTATLMVLCNAAGLIVKTLALPLRTHDASQIAHLLDAMQRGDVLVYDRAACSFVHLALLFQRQMHGIFRMHQRQIVCFKPGRKHAGQFPKGQRRGKPTSQWLERLGRDDQRVKWLKPKRRPQWMTQEQYDALPDDLVLRELRYTVKRKGYRCRSITLVTTLTDRQQYPAAELAEQYRDRWDIELNLRHLKQTMGMDVLKCKTVDGVQKELAVFVGVYNLVRLAMLAAAERQKVPPGRISFVDALRWLCTGAVAVAQPDLIVNSAPPPASSRGSSNAAAPTTPS